MKSPKAVGSWIASVSSIASIDSAPAGQVVDGDQRQVMLCGEDPQVIQAHHFTVVLGDFPDHAHRFQSGSLAQVNGRFGMPAAFEHSPGRGTQREDVAGAGELSGLRLRVSQQAAGQRAVGSRDAGGDALGGIAGDGEGGAFGILVDADHGCQAQRVSAVRRPAVRR